MSPTENRRARRVLYARRNQVIDSVDLSTLTYNPYKKCYQTKKAPTLAQHSTQIKYGKSIPTDDEWIGDKMTSKPKNNFTRFWLQNARGIPASFDGNLFRYDLTNIQKNNIHYYALPESKINTSNSNITNHLSQIQQNVFGSGVLTMTNSQSFPKKCKHQPGGIASGFFGRLENRYAKTYRDPLGRWHYHEFFGLHNLLRIYTLYRVNPRPSTNGDTTAWVQQHNLLLKQGCTDNPRKKVIHDIYNELEEAIDSGT